MYNRNTLKCLSGLIPLYKIQNGTRLLLYCDNTAGLNEICTSIFCFNLNCIRGRWEDIPSEAKLSEKCPRSHHKNSA